MTVGDEGVVGILDVGGVQPDRGASVGVVAGVEVGARQDLAQRERDRRGVEDDGVGRSGGGADEAEVLLVERPRDREVAGLQGDEVERASALAALRSMVQSLRSGGESA